MAPRGQAGLELIHDYPLAFVLLYVIAQRARWSDRENRHNLGMGEALIGDYYNYGMSEKEYRVAKAHLDKRRIVAFKRTNRGTVALLMDTDVFDINVEFKGEQKGGRRALPGRCQGVARATNEERNNKGKKGKNGEVHRLTAFSKGGTGGKSKPARGEDDFIHWLEEFCGTDEVARCGGMWRLRYRHDTCGWMRVKNAAESDRREGIIARHTPGALLTDLAKRFKIAFPPPIEPTQPATHGGRA